MNATWGLTLWPAIYLGMLALIAVPVRRRLAVLDELEGFAGYLLALGLTFFGATWANFLLYVIFGWGELYLVATWCLALMIGACFWCWPQTKDNAAINLSAATGVTQLSPWFWVLAVLVLSRFYFGLRTDEAGQIWCNFNFVDTAFHLSVTNSLLESPRFPPTDLDLAPFPLKYHFLADFHVAHLVRLGAVPIAAMALMNVVSGLTMVGALWAFFSRVLRLPGHWILLAGLVFLFLSLPLVNLVHYLWLKPRYFNAEAFVEGVLRFPFFNFESMQGNLFEPQRGLLFSLPVILWVLQTTFGGAMRAGSDVSAEGETKADDGSRKTLLAFAFVCLLPLAHIVAFAVLGLCLVPALWRMRARLGVSAVVWAPALIVGSLQLFYLFIYGPSLNEQFSGRDVASAMQLGNFAALPAWCRRAVFWFFANGDFFGWGLLALAVAGGRRWLGRKAPGYIDASWAVLVRWRWYAAVCLACFLFINLYRYSYDWGDSNKFVLFINLGLTLVIVQGAAHWREGAWRDLSWALWMFFATLCVAAPAYEFYKDVIAAPRGKILLFQAHGIVASEWLRDAAGPNDIVLTAADNTFHYVTALAGAPTLAGLYSGSNPNRQPERPELIRRIYEGGELALLKPLGVRFVSLSRAERRRYRIHPIWQKFMENDTGVAFRSGRPDEFDAAFIFEVAKLFPDQPQP